MRRLVVLLSLLASAWPISAPAQPAATPAASVAKPDAATTGPRKRIAVLKFDAGGLTAAPGIDLGGGLAAQMTTALVDTGQFIVVERAELAAVLREQELGVQKLATSETSAQVGKLVGAQLLVRASITEFEQKAGGGGVRVGVGVPLGTGALGAATNTGIVGIDVRLIDTSTGQVVRAFHTEGKIQDRALSADVGVKNVHFRRGRLREDAARPCRTDRDRERDARRRRGERCRWHGAAVSSNRPASNSSSTLGADAGLKTGDAFVVSTVVRELTDPSTGAVLGVIEDRLGEVRVVSVQPGYSIAQMSAPFTTKRGDLVRPVVR
jgi:curli biogenesis system outer membrane secretion channel CsgG